MWQLFKQDVQRWIVPQAVSDPALVTFSTTVKALWTHMPLRAMFWFRLGSWCRQKRIPGLAGMLQRAIHRAHGMDIAVGSDYGGGLYLAHTIGNVIAARTIGRNCTIVANVTLGMRNEWAFPTIGDDVFIGAGARVLGGIHVGDGAVIGANAVVIEDVPPGAVVVGIPARVIRIKEQPQQVEA